MTIAVIGANGKVGRLVVSEALARGYRVHAFVHSRNTLGEHANLTVFKGDAANPADVTPAITQCDAVISVLSSWKTPTHDTLARGMDGILPAMEATKVQRLISLTGGGAYDIDDRLSPLDRFGHFVFSLIAGKVLTDAELHIKKIRASTLAWTVLRSPIMTNQEKTTYTLVTQKQAALWWLIPRQAVAHALLNLATSREHTQEVVTIRM